MFSNSLNRIISGKSAQLKTNKNAFRFFHLIKNKYQASAGEIYKTLKNIPKKRAWPKYLLFTSLVSGGSFMLYYQFYLNEQEKRKIRVDVQSLGRAARSSKVGASIAFDYKWNLWGLDEDSEEYNKKIRECHLRSAQKMVETCIANGGMFNLINFKLF
jgi:hypothetical protein